MLDTTTPCVACIKHTLAYFGERNGYTYYKCTFCGTLQLHPMPNAETLTAAYENEYAEAGHCQADPEVRNKAARRQFDGITNALVSHCTPNRVLECGPGWGGLLEALRDKQVVAEGVELSAAMADYCEHNGHTIHRCALEELPGERLYDAVLLSAVFEHLVNHEQWLAATRRLLEKDGLLISFQPTAPFATLMATVFRFGMRRSPLPQLHQIFWPPWHTVLFSLAGMQALLERNGFELVEVRAAPLQQEGGFTGILQRILSFSNALAVPVFGVNWPLCVSHIFIFRVNK